MPPPSSSAAAAEAEALAATLDDLVSRAIDAGIASHAELPARVRAMLPASEWRSRCKSLLLRKGVAWGASAAAKGCCGEREYYESLVKYYLEAKRVREIGLREGKGKGAKKNLDIKKREGKKLTAKRKKTSLRSTLTTWPTSSLASSASRRRRSTPRCSTRL